MTSPPTADRPNPPNPPALEAFLLRFDQAWQQGAPPRIEEYLAALPTSPASAGAATRRTFLEELVMIDLEYRWRLAALGVVAPAGSIRERPRLEDYVAHHAELGGLPQLSLELIAAEYRIRRRWGDRPGQAEYTARFPRQGPKLLEVLRQLDTELSTELAAPERLISHGEGPAVKVRPGAADPGIASVPALIEALRRCELLSKVQLEEMTRQLAPRLTEPRALARELLQRGWLTPYQINQLFLGRGAELVLGGYLILERLGEGGTGQVFKARHLRMNRVVALKLLRKELLADTELVQRFYREIRVLSQLEHPNIVHALDAGPAGLTHLLVMEYVVGTDLARLVKQKGPLPVPQAIDFIRQAALGLHHAHERGLVHRDIKPHNLMLSKPGPKGTESGQIKILDLGLARLQRPMDSDTTARLDEDQAGSLTPVGAVMMGTADYMAPEQALDFHQADIRADIYSLGATFYYLLTGQPPFPGGTLTQKLLRHQQAEAPSVKHSRRDVPPAVAAVVGKMLAKRPQDRYQVPADVVRALAEETGHSIDRRMVLHRGAAIGLVLVGAAGLGWWLLGSSTPTKPNLTVRPIEPGWQHQAPVRQVVFGPDGNLVYSGSSDFTVYVTDRTTGKRQSALDLKEKLPTVHHFNISPDAKMLALGSETEDLAKLWNLATDREAAVFRGHQILSGLHFIALGPESKVLASIGGTRGRAIKLTNVATGRYTSPSLEPGLGGILALAFSADCKALAVAGEDKLIKLYNVAMEAKQGAWAEERHILKGHGAAVRAVAFAPDGKTLASGGLDKSIRLWDAAAGKPLTTMEPADGGTINVVTFSTDGQTLATAGGDPKIRLWDVASGRQLHAWNRPRGAVLALAFSPRGTFVLAAGSEDGTVQLWEIMPEK